jgi:FKBP-type peptidyl-prolyl cis-trans isomerase FkpA
MCASVVAQDAPPVSPTPEIAARSLPRALTVTTLKVTAGTLGQPITFNVKVWAHVAAGSPEGTINLFAHGTLLETLTLSPATSAFPRYACSEATFTLTPQPGGSAYYFGEHLAVAVFVPGSNFLKSSCSRIFTVKEPDYTTLSDGVKMATIVDGSGAQIQAGQTASVFYTGYLAINGEIFDDSEKDGGTPLSFTLGAGQVITGFDEGTAGMQVGETRIVRIPPAEGYGGRRAGPIPPNSILIFVITLESAS